MFSITKKIVMLSAIFCLMAFTGAAFSDNLQAYYPMNGSGSTVVDYSPNSNDGNTVGNVLRQQQVCNRQSACGFTDDGNIEIPHDSTIDITQDLTISAWVKMDDSYYSSDLGSSGNPADSCKHVYDMRENPSDGFYYISPDGGSSIQMYCDMDTAGGGWGQIFSGSAGRVGNNMFKYTTGRRDSSNGYIQTDVRRFRNSHELFRYEYTSDTGTWNTHRSSDDPVYSRNRLENGRTGFDWLECVGEGCSAFTPAMYYKCYWSDNYWSAQGWGSGNYDDGFPSGSTSGWNIMETDTWRGILPGVNGGDSEFLLSTKSGGYNCDSSDTRNNHGNVGIKEHDGTGAGIVKRESYGIGLDDEGIDAFVYNEGMPHRAEHNFQNPDQWNQVRMIYDYSEAEIRLYVNDKLVSTTAAGSESGKMNHHSGGESLTQDSIDSNSKALEIGRFPGKVADVKIYNDVVEQSDVDLNDMTSGKISKFNLSVRNQTGEPVNDAQVEIREEGKDELVCGRSFETDATDGEGYFLSPPLDQKVIYNLEIFSDEFQNNFVFRNVRLPDKIEAGFNQNFIPESTMDESIKFSAGHTLPAQTMITRPFSDFDVVNVSIEKNFNDSYRLVSDVLVRKYNVNFEGQWQDWSNRKTVTVQDIYNRDWSDSTGEMNDAWGIIEFNPEGFQNNDCSDVRLTDTENNVQDFTVNTCQDDYVQLEFNAPIDALEAKDFYVYYGNSEASDAQTSVERISETEDFQMDNGITDTEGGFWFQSAGQKNFNMSIPQNVEFLNREINIEGNNQDPQDNQLSSSIDDDYQEYSGIEFTPKRPTVIEGMDLEMASTTVDSEIAIRNMSSGSIIHTRSIPDNGPGSYYINFTDETLSEGNGDNIIYRPSDTFRVIVRNGQARRDTGTVTSSPMYEFPDFTVDNQVYSCSSDASSCSTGDYPTLVSSIETISLLPDLTITYDNEDTVLYDEAQHLNTGTIDLSSVLQSEEWREGDPLDDPRVHEFTVDSGDEGNITLESYSSFEFEHPVESVTKNAAACSVNPQSSTYFYIDKTDCPYLDRINVTQGQWFRLDYRFRVPGPSDFENTGDINSYNVSDTMVRYNTLAETEEFTSG